VPMDWVAPLVWWSGAGTAAGMPTAVVASAAAAATDLVVSQVAGRTVRVGSST
jgi:hypothetical protein